MVFPTFVCSHKEQKVQQNGAEGTQGLEARAGSTDWLWDPSQTPGPGSQSRAGCPSAIATASLAPWPAESSWASPSPSRIKAVPAPSTIHRRLLALSEQILLITLDTY